MNETEQKNRKKTSKWLLYNLLAAVLLIVLACVAPWRIMIDMPGESYRGELPKADQRLTDLAAELRKDVVALATDIGERHIPDRRDQLDQSANFIAAQFETAGYKVVRQEYEVAGCKCSNIEVEIPGSSHPNEIVVVGAHYDTARGTPGADDNTSAVAGMLALARRFAKSKPDRTLRFVAFVNEEGKYARTPDMGSRVCAKIYRDRGDNVVAMVCLEMIGFFSDKPNSQRYPQPLAMLYPSVGNFIAFVGNLNSRDLVRQMIANFRRNEPFPSEGVASPEWVPGIRCSDHESFWHEGYPAVMVTDTAMFRNSNYHQPTDTPDTLDFDRMARVVRGVEHIVVELVSVAEK